jgi:RHS repeat-associated protein
MTAREPISGNLNSQKGDQNKVQVDIVYFDGLGRPELEVQREASPGSKDWVKPVRYDTYGRAFRDNLFYESDSTNGAYIAAAFTGLTNWYAQFQPNVQTNLYPYSQKKYEPSPLGRVIEQSSPGADWKLGSGHEQKFAYRTNKTSDAVKLITLDSSDYTANAADYGAGTLWVSSATDEDGIEVESYTNKSGQTVLRVVGVGSTEEAHTYYVYDEFDLLTMVIPPNAVDEIGTDWDKLNDYDFRRKWLFQYRYDDRSRLIESYVPGAAVVEMIYDQRDRLVLTRDGNRRNIDEQHQYITEDVNVSENNGDSFIRVPGSKVVLKAGYTTAGAGTIKIAREGSVAHEWLFTKYDHLNRPVMTGITSLTGTRQELQDAINANSSYDFTENYVGDTASDILGYNNSAYPQVSSADVLTVTYYDNYDHHSDLGWGSAYIGTHGETVLTEAQGLVTGGYTRILTNSKWLKKVIRYDDQRREKLVITQNAMDGWDRTHITYRNEVSALVASTYSINRIHSGYNYLYEFFTYDHRDRLLKVEHQIGNSSSNKETLANMSYNAIGQLVEKKLHDDGTPAQTVGFGYNERGWLKTINGGTSFDHSDDKFGMTLKYADAFAGYERYNGNIGEMKWKSKGGTNLPENTQTYLYTYDDLNRLTEANYSGSAGNFNTKNLVYDKNGNIQRLKRIGVNSLAVDDLLYDYSGNQLTRVEDSEDQNAGFIDVTSSVGTKEYQYDYSGNMVKDLNKGVTEIVYNYLNLPEQVTMDNGDTIHYAYDASGVKHYKIVDDGTPDTTQYVGPFHFTNSDLKFIQHTEGRAIKNGSSYDYEYNLSDHLGNVRVTVDESGSVVQRQDYYAFGGTFNEWTSGTENLYKYNTFEEQKETGWYDYQARFYDPTLGRFLNVDPAADLMRRHSTYAYAFNNPIRFIDPDGMKPSDQSHDNGAASTATDDHDAENFQTDGYGELSHAQRSEVGDAGRYHKSSEAAKAALFKIPSKKEIGDPSYDQTNGGIQTDPLYISRIDIDKTNQQMTLQWVGEGAEDQPTGPYKISTGKRDNTPSGEYVISWKYRTGMKNAKGQVSQHPNSLPSHPEAHWAVNITGAFFIHTYPNVPDYPASAGCVRCVAGAGYAELIWRNVKLGTTVANLHGQWPGFKP